MNQKRVFLIVALGLACAGCSVHPPSPAPMPSCEAAVRLPDKLETHEDVWSSDGRLHINNRFNDGPGTMADYTITFAWDDGGQHRQWVRDSAEHSQGWVESIGVFRTSAGPVYVVVDQGRWATSQYTIGLHAYRIRPGADALEPVEGFFPPIPGASERGDAIWWEHWRTRGHDIYPRPFGVRFDERRQCVQVWVLPHAGRDYRPAARDMADGRVLTLSLNGDRLVGPDLTIADREAFERACDMHRLLAREHVTEDGR